MQWVALASAPSHEEKWADAWVRRIRGRCRILDWNRTEFYPVIYNCGELVVAGFVTRLCYTEIMLDDLFSPSFLRCLGNTEAMDECNSHCKRVD